MKPATSLSNRSRACTKLVEPARHLQLLAAAAIARDRRTACPRVILRRNLISYSYIESASDKEIARSFE